MLALALRPQEPEDDRQARPFGTPTACRPGLRRRPGVGLLSNWDRCDGCSGGGVVAGESTAQPGGPLAGLTAGARVAGYRLEKLVGVGGMAAVYRARDERLGRVVALKLLAGDEVVRKRFVRAARFISPVASALDAAHDAGLVHRDVKPANMLVDVGPGRPEHVYLSDFGVARGVMSSSGLTRAGQFLGTPDYAAPEQISGRDVDGRADQYALACVAYTLLSGTVLFRRDVPMAVLYAHLSVPPPRLTTARPELPDAVNQVLAQALAKEPDDRYDSCGTFADALREALGLEPYDPSRPAGSPAMPPSRNAATAPLTIPPDSPPTKLLPGSPSLPSMTSLPSPPSGSPSRPAAAATWTAVVAADRAYYDSVQ